MTNLPIYFVKKEDLIVYDIIKDILGLDNIDLSYIKERELNSAEKMLNMIDPSKGIMISEEIGLLGFGEEKDFDKTVFHDINDDKLAFAYIDTFISGFRGDYFYVISEDGCILFDYYIVSAGIIREQGNIIGYVFRLKDYDSEEDFFESGYYPGLVLYMDGKLYVNNLKDKEVAKKIGEYKDFSIERTGVIDYTLKIENKIYHSTAISLNYDIFTFIK